MTVNNHRYTTNNQTNELVSVKDKESIDNLNSVNNNSENENIENKSSDIKDNSKVNSDLQNLGKVDYDNSNKFDFKLNQNKLENYQIEPNKEIGKTKTGAVILEHDDTKEVGHKKTDYLCGHVFRIGTEIKNEEKSNLKYSGFIHMSKEPKEEQYFDVLGTSIKGYADKMSNKNPVTIMVSGFTKFDGIKDNPTSRFLFNDGTSENYGLMKADNSKIDNMMKDKFGEPSKTPEPIFKEINGVKTEVGRSYTYKDSKTNEEKTINLTFVRLPVDDNLTNKEDFKQNLRDFEMDSEGNETVVNFATVTNYAGDNTGKTLKEAIKNVNPDAIISFGAGTEGNENYYIETTSYGMKEKGAVYTNENETIKNEDLSNIFKEQLKTKNN